MTNTLLSSPPAADEHVAYYGKYVALVPDGSLLTTLETQHRSTMALLEKNAGRADHAYAPGKWTVREVMGHLADAERIFAYRALRFARGDATPVPGFEEDAYVAGAIFGRVPLDLLLEELRVVRRATLSLARQLTDEALARRGSANGAEMSVRALFYITAGHELHHVGILRERYGLD